MAALVQDETRARLLAILNDKVLSDRLVLHMAKSYRAEDALAQIDKLLGVFKANLAGAH